MLREVKKPRDENKLKRQYDGPYRVVQVKRPNVTIRGLVEQDVVELHMDKIRIYREPYVLPWRASKIPKSNANESLTVARKSERLAKKQRVEYREESSGTEESE